MDIIKRLKWKDKTGKTTDYDLGAKASNVEQDANHRFVSDAEKQTWNGKADPDDIPSGSAADYGVANNDTTNRADMLVTAQVAYQHGREIDQLNSELIFEEFESQSISVPTGASLSTPNHANIEIVIPEGYSVKGVTLISNDAAIVCTVQQIDIERSLIGVGLFNTYNKAVSIKVKALIIFKRT